MLRALQSSRRRWNDQLDALVSRDRRTAPWRLRRASSVRSSTSADHVRTTSRSPAGRWEAVYEGVYRIVGTPLIWRGRAPCRVLGRRTRAVASHRIAAELWELPGARRDASEITCPRWQRARSTTASSSTSRSRSTDEDICDPSTASPCTTVARTLFDLRRGRRPTTVDLAIDNALRRQTDDAPAARAAARCGWRRRGRRGHAPSSDALLALQPAIARTTESEAGAPRSLRLSNSTGSPHRHRSTRSAIATAGWSRDVDFAYPDTEDRDRVRQLCPPPRHATPTIVTARDGTRSSALGWYPITATATTCRNGGHRLASEIRRGPLPDVPASEQCASSSPQLDAGSGELRLGLEQDSEAAGGDAEADGAHDGEVGDVQEHRPGSWPVVRPRSRATPW